MKCLIASLSVVASVFIFSAHAEYAVVDISTGTAGTKFPVSFSATEPTGEGLKTTKLVLRKIPAGTFKKGGTVDTTVSKPFYIGVYEVTKKQYQLITGVSGIGTQSGDAEPVNGVSYTMLRGTSSVVAENTLLGVLRAKTGVAGFDLPTDDQWEYACRAGTTSLYNNGGNSASDLDLLGRYNAEGKGLATVGSYLPNAWGLYDMHGNVCEWCLGPVVRGGCASYLAAECTSSSYNDYFSSDNNSAFFGVRVACSAETLEGLDLPVVSEVTAKQHYPWCGKVDIGYKVTGRTEGLKVVVSVRDNDNELTYTAKTFDVTPSAAAGAHAVVWNASADGVKKVSKNMVATVSLVVAD